MGQRHPQPRCCPALFKNNLHGMQPASASPPGKGELAAPGCQYPPAPVLCTRGIFSELSVQPRCLPSFHRRDRDGESFASPPPARHPGRKVTTCLGEEGNRQPDRSPNPRMGHREGASSNGYCRPEPLPRGMGMPQTTSRHGSTGGSAGDLVLGSGTQLGTQQGFFRLSFLLRASPGKSKSGGCHAPAAQGARQSLPCQRCIPPAPWQRAEQLVQSGRSQKAL